MGSWSIRDGYGKNANDGSMSRTSGVGDVQIAMEKEHLLANARVHTHIFHKYTNAIM